VLGWGCQLLMWSRSPHTKAQFMEMDGEVLQLEVLDSLQLVCPMTSFHVIVL